MRCSDLVVRAYAALSVAAMMCGCMVPEVDTVKASEKEKVLVEFSASLSGMEADVKSILPEETIESKMSQVTIASYDAKGRI